MVRERKLSPQTIAVLDALAAQPDSWRYGYELCGQVGLKAGSMYPILVRLAERGLLETRWETEQPAGRPPRHLYRLSGQGHELARSITPTRARRARSPRPRLEGA
ncbi:helix-turn-helix transcriptional regulator [Actinokineospora auranticolor]|uniref:PadR family transcriptional regulator n=1 Tax=Actinokineospora auranticolor TaxID=155976 RepID=A0A2S6GPS4_9PSEU|nr:helix-turn-helix transcriptional regulator [Actinokineospora auranticolor]PPK67228.1 PadR family transcriptional regulator [Actinokineospora auranticolor]